MADSGLGAGADRIRRVVFCTPSLDKVADNRGVKEAFRYHVWDFMASFVPALLAVGPPLSVR
jgi:hypothetical protein